jgi:uncharacterized membrane protein
VTSSPLEPWVGAIAATQITVIIWLVGRSCPPRYRAGAMMAMLAVVATLLSGLPVRSVGLAMTGICHTLAYSSLLIWFAASLRPGHEPVVTGLARRIRQTMPAKVIRYTRQVTIAWCVFFAAQLTVSAGLLLLAPQAVWATFVSLLNTPLLLVMVFGEFACRTILFRNEPRTGLMDTLSAMRRSRFSPASKP